MRIQAKALVGAMSLFVSGIAIAQDPKPPAYLEVRSVPHGTVQTHAYK